MSRESRIETSERRERKGEEKEEKEAYEKGLDMSDEHVPVNKAKEFRLFRL